MLPSGYAAFRQHTLTRRGTQQQFVLRYADDVLKCATAGGKGNQRKI